MEKSFKLWLIWQNVDTRQRYHIGTLVHDDGLYKFYYEKEGERRNLKEAMQNGYRPHLAFPDVNKKYVSNQLFGPFARRLPDKRRPDFDEILLKLGLSTDYTHMDLLRATGGRLATDSYEFVSPVFLDGNHFDFDFFIAGWRYYNGETVLDSINPGDEVRFLLDKNNDFDTKAIIVLTNKKGDKIGYIPSFYSGFMYEVIKKGCSYKTVVEKINRNAVPQRKVNISVVGQLNSDFDKSVIDKESELQLVTY